MVFAIDRLTRNGTALAFEAAGAGPPVVLLHGFPDTAETWSNTQSLLAAAGHTSAALHLRGYPPSDIPQDGDYSIRAQAEDALAVIDHLGVERAAIVGHDWGAAAAYAAAAIAPERLSCIAALAIAPPAVCRSSARELFARPHNLYLRPGAFAAWWLRRRNFADIDRLYRKWSPHWTPPKDHIARVTAALDAPGRARAAVDYYSAGTAPGDADLFARKSQVPTLVMYGSDEPAVRKEWFAQAATALGPGSEVICFDDVGHWPHLEAPERFQTALLDFLGRHHGNASADTA